MEPRGRRKNRQWPWMMFLALGLAVTIAGGCALDLEVDAPFICNIGTPKCPTNYRCQVTGVNSKNEEVGVCVMEGTCPSSVATCPQPTEAGVNPKKDGGGGPFPPRGKFCNNLKNKDGSNLTLMLVVGNAQLIADTGKCTTCKNLPAKVKQDVNLWKKGEASPYVSGSIDIKGSTEYIFIADLDDNSDVTIKGGALDPKYKCATYDPWKSQ